MNRLRVIRITPKDRSLIGGLTGQLTFTVEVLAPLHIGGTRTSLEGAERIISHMKEAVGSVEDKIRELQFLVEKGPIGKKVATLFSLGGKPSIPGSSLKGAVRSRLELSFMGYNGEVPSCFSVVGGKPFMAEKGRPGWRHQKIYPSSLEDRGPPCDHTGHTTVCKVCDIFGAPGLASRIHFPSIEFDCETDVFNASFTGDMYVEVIPRGCKAQGSITFLNMEPYELGLVLIGMGDMKPLLIGFGKYREHPDGDMGKVRITPVEWSFLPVSTRILRGLGVSFQEGEILRVRDAEGLWKILVSKARGRYSNYLREVDISA